MRMFYTQQAIWNLRNVRLFENVTPQELRELSVLLEDRQYRRGEFLFHMGEMADRLFFLQKGSVKVSILSPAGEERILDIFRPGDTFGEMFFGEDNRRIGTAVALTDVAAQIPQPSGQCRRRSKWR